MLKLIWHGLFIVRGTFFNRIVCFNVINESRDIIHFHFRISCYKQFVCFTYFQFNYTQSSNYLIACECPCMFKLIYIYVDIKSTSWVLNTDPLIWFSSFCFCSKYSLLLVVHKRKASKIIIIITINTYFYKLTACILLSKCNKIYRAIYVKSVSPIMHGWL